MKRQPGSIHNNIKMTPMILLTSMLLFGWLGTGTIANGANVDFPLQKGLLNDTTSGKKTYQNEQFGFAFNYPDSCTVHVYEGREENGMVFTLLTVSIDDSHNRQLISIAVAGPDFMLGTRDWEPFSLGEIDGKICYFWKDYKVRKKITGFEIIYTSPGNRWFDAGGPGDPIEDIVVKEILSSFRWLK